MVIVNGSLDNLQSSIDFYLKIVSSDLDYDDKAMRKKFFDIFKKEDLCREENFLVYSEKVSDDYEICNNANPVLVGDEKEFTYGEFSFADCSEDDEEYPDDSEVYKDTSFLDIEKSNLEIEKKSLDTEKNNLEIEYSILDIEKNDLENEKNNLEEEKINLEIEKNNSETKNIELDEDEFISYGNEDTSDDNFDEDDEDSGAFSNVDFTRFASRKEDIVENTDFNPFACFMNSNKEKEKEEVNSSEVEDIEEDEDESTYGNNEGIDSDEIEDIDEILFNNWGSDDDYSDTDEIVNTEGNNTELWGNENEYQDYEEEFSWGSYSDESDFNDEKEYTSIEEVVEENKEDISEFFGGLEEFDNSINIDNLEIKETKNKVSEVSRSLIDEAKDVPKDLRDFVKLYPNCEMSFALKYFTKKEIDKQLSLGRIFKRKNKLLI